MRRFLPAVAATIITAGALAVPSLAQDATEDTTTEQSEQATDERAEARAEAKARYNELLAAELGVSVDELTAAQESVREVLKAEKREDLVARLDEKVAAGEITQEQADEILARFDSGERPFGRRGHRGGPRGFGGGSGDADAEATAA